jgi:hypothetical protein
MALPQVTCLTAERYNFYCLHRENRAVGIKLFPNGKGVGNLRLRVRNSTLVSISTEMEGVSSATISGSQLIERSSIDPISFSDLLSRTAVLHACARACLPLGSSYKRATISLLHRRV